MNNKQMLHALRDKMSAEMGVFEDWLLTLPPKEILEHTFEHNAKTNIVLLLDSADLSNEQLRVCCPRPFPWTMCIKRSAIWKTSWTPSR